jgi:hypothetical protein
MLFGITLLFPLSFLFCKWLKNRTWASKPTFVGMQTNITRYHTIQSLFYDVSF